MTAITQSVDLDRRGRIAVLTVNNPPVNALSQHVRQGLYDGVTRAIADAAVGVETALQMIVSGEPIGGDAALTHGLIDAIVEGDPAAAGVAFAETVVSERRPLKKIRDLEDKLAQARGTPELFANFRKSVARQTRGFRAPENRSEERRVGKEGRSRWSP